MSQNFTSFRWKAYCYLIIVTGKNFKFSGYPPCEVHGTGIRPVPGIIKTGIPVHLSNYLTIMLDQMINPTGIESAFSVFRSVSYHESGPNL
jgi:hypothetical protein